MAMSVASVTGLPAGSSSNEYGSESGTSGAPSSLGTDSRTANTSANVNGDSGQADVHLVLLLHGLYGSPTNLWCLEEEIANLNRKNRGAARADASTVSTEETHGQEETTATRADNGGGHGVSETLGAMADAAMSAAVDVVTGADTDATIDPSPDLDLVVLNAKSYVGAHTWDGIDVNALRVSEELDAEIARLEAEGRRVSAISITGYSLGGLIARALVGQLHARTPSFFEKHRPASFATIATPHLGVLKYPSWQSQWVHALGQRLFSRTGQQLYCLDTEHGGPLLATMAHPDRIYLRALSLFRSITIFANGINDLTVPYCTAAICAHDPFVDHEVLVDGRPHVHVELDGYIVCNWSSDPDAIEVEEMVCVVDSSRSNTATPPEDVAREGPSAPPKPPRSPRLTPATTAGLMPSQRPWFPPPFYLNKPGILRYALFPLIPFLIPLVLSVIAITFAYHSFQSSQRLRVHQANGDKRPLLLGIDDSNDESTGYGATGTTDRSQPRDTPRGSDDDVNNNNNINNDGSPSSPSARPSRTGTPQLVPPGSTNSQPALTPLQHSMIAHLSSLPLERVIAWFPSAFNSHAVIIARNARNPRWAWQGAGRQVVRDWAARVRRAEREVVAALGAA